MFQYAFGRSLALRTGALLRLDASHLDKYSTRQYALNAFNISGRRVSRVQHLFLRASDSPILRRLGFFFLGFTFLTLVRDIRDQETGFDASVIALRGSCVLEGYWQSDKYFREHELSIRKDFRFLLAASFENQTLLDRVARVNSVAVHVRRGDYVNNLQHNHVHGTCSPEYYVAAAYIIRERVVDPRFFVFSDDPDWAEQHLNLPGPTEVVRINQGRADFEDMRLMAACKHFIIANSSFSWWAAWLGVYREKVVVAPSRWFANHHADTSDLLPDTWIRI